MSVIRPALDVDLKSHHANKATRGGVCDMVMTWRKDFRRYKRKWFPKRTVRWKQTVQWFCCCSRVGTSPPTGICLVSSSSCMQIHLQSSSRRPSRRDQRSALASRWALPRRSVHLEIFASSLRLFDFLGPHKIMRRARSSPPEPWVWNPWSKAFHVRSQH